MNGSIDLHQRLSPEELRDNAASVRREAELKALMYREDAELRAKRLEDKADKIEQDRAHVSDPTPA